MILGKKGSNSSDTLESDLASMGLDISVMEPWRLEQLQQGAGDFELWEEHIPVVELFARSVRQWRTAGEQFLGIDYVALEVVAKLTDTALDAELFNDFQIMEARAAELLNERKPEKKRGRKR